MRMDEYIDKKALLDALYNADAITMNGVKILNQFPSADVSPVRHGRWEWFEEWNPSTPNHPTELDDCGWRCGKCKIALEDVVGGCWDNPDEEPKLKYCPDCGAKMDL